MKPKQIIRRLLWALLFVFIFMNVVAIFHAYKFTHYDASGTSTHAGHWAFSRKLGTLLFGVNNPRPAAVARPDTSFETVQIKSNKQIECWLIRVPDSKGTVALFHGYGGEKSSMLDKAEVFRHLGYSTLLVDFMGSGGSEGNETTIGYKEAEEVKSCFDYLQLRGEHNVILFGTSMGAAAVMKAMSDYQLPVRSIIIECPFGTMVQTVKNRFANMGIPSFPLAYMLLFWGGVENGFNAFGHNPATYARHIKCHTLLLYGEKDIKVRRQETDMIFSNLAGAKSLTTFPMAGHENYLAKYKEKWTRAIFDFLNADSANRYTEKRHFNKPVFK